MNPFNYSLAGDDMRRLPFGERLRVQDLALPPHHRHRTHRRRHHPRTQPQMMSLVKGEEGIPLVSIHCLIDRRRYYRVTIHNGKNLLLI